jgi:conjugal transfer pilus assembly protein TraD
VRTATASRSVLGRRRTPGRAQQSAVASPDRLVGEADGERGFTLATRLAGERALPVDRGLVLLSPERLCKHVLVCGATGSGKTETVMRLVYAVAMCSDAPVFYLDGKGDRDTAERFVGLMAAAGRSARVFPNEPFDGWRGEAHEIHGRLMEVIDYSTDGPASWYRDVAKNVLRLVCEHPDGPPRSTLEVLARMNLDGLKAAHGPSSALAALTGQQVSQVRLRYEAFFGQTRGALDGTWAWEDTTAAYLLLDSLFLREEASGLARLLFEDFSHYFTVRKAKSQFALLIVDEFSALAEGSGMAARVEQARGFNTSLVLAPQVVAGMGDDAQAARILGSVETVICHRVNTPEEIIALAGTRKAMEYSSQYAEEGATGAGSARVQHQFKVDPNKVRGLPPGHAYAISRGRAMRICVLRAPESRGRLPGPLPANVAVGPERAPLVLPSATDELPF